MAGAQRRNIDPYAELGRGYALQRREDSRIAGAIANALGEATTVVNVGAGTGSYEPRDREVTAVEPSQTMIAQRRDRPGTVVCASAESLPFGDNSFDAAMAILTLHHWSHQREGVAELRRVTRGPVVILTVEPDWWRRFWLTRDYLPETRSLDENRFPRCETLLRWLGGGEIVAVPIPADCTDAFLGANWARPERYLDPEVQGANSVFAILPRKTVADALDALAADLASGTWDDRYGHLRQEQRMDLGYRLVVSRPA